MSRELEWPGGTADGLAEQLEIDQKAGYGRVRSRPLELLCDPTTNRCALAFKVDVEEYDRRGEVMGELTMREFGIKAREKCGEQVNVLARMENDDEGRLGFRLIIYSGKSEVGTGFDLEDLGKAAREALESVGKRDPFVTIKR